MPNPHNDHPPTLGISAGTAALIGGGLAAAGSIGGAAIGAANAPEGVQAHQLAATGWNPNQDPLLSALSLNAGAGIGQFDPNVYQQAAPLQQLLNQAQSGGMLNMRQFRQLQFATGIKAADYAQLQGLTGRERKQKLRELGYSGDALNKAVRGLDLAEQQARTAGYGSLGDLLTKNQEYLGKLPEIQAQYQPVADKLRAGLLASQGRVGDYLQNLPNLLTGDQNPFIDQLRQEALITSQKYGVNPYQYLEQARSTALQRALQLISGEQAVQSGQQAMALPVAQLRQQGGATAAGLGAGQAQALAAALQSQQNAQANQAAQWGQLGNTIGQFGLIGADMLGGAGAGTGPATGPVTSSNNYAVGNWEP